MKNALSGTFTDGSGSSDYSNNADCQWLITLPDSVSSAQIVIIFTEFSTQSEQDYVHVSDCYSYGCNNQLAVLYGAPSTPQIITTVSPPLKVRFISDSSITGAGFSATWIMVCQPSVQKPALNWTHECILH
jgi:hypothetical protein